MRFIAALLLSLPACLLADELVVVTRQGCPPCAAIKRDLLRKPELYRGHSLRLLEGRDAMAEWSVDLVPTVIRLRDGQEVARAAGYTGPRDFTRWMRRHD